MRAVLMCFVLRLHWWKEGFGSAVADDGVLLPSLFRGALGMREPVVSGSGRRQCFFFGVGGMGREGTETHGVRVMFTVCLVFKQTKIYVFMFCIICLGVIRTLEGWSGS